jgi:two-component system, OmpR family, sensor histidine kinase MprB
MSMKQPGGDDQPKHAEPSGDTWLRLPGVYRFPFGAPAAAADEESHSREGAGVTAATASSADAESLTKSSQTGEGSFVERLRDGLGRISLRSRVALLVAFAVGLAVAASSVAAYLTVRSQLYASVDDNLLLRARAAAAAGLSSAQLATIDPGFLGAADVRIGIISAAGETAPHTRYAPPMGNAELAVAQGRAPDSLRTVTTGGVEYRVVAVPVAESPGGGIALVLAQPLKATKDLLGRLGLVLFLVGAAGVGVAAWAGLAIARAGLRPVERLTAAAEHVAATEKLEPIEVRGQDELARLARSFNEMLAALKGSRERQQQLVADAGHELRTPLTSLRTNIDLLVQSSERGGLSAADRAELLADVRAQSEELTLLVQDLVELARDDQPDAQAEELDFAEVCERAVDRIKRRVPDVTFEVKLAPWKVHGDGTALERAVVNVLDNAAKWSPPHGTVRVHLDGGELRVVDQGPGIPDADLPHVFERFYRTSDARRLPGSGLGLAIVKQVVERHGGSVEVAPAETGGAQITFRLPADR